MMYARGTSTGAHYPAAKGKQTKFPRRIVFALVLLVCFAVLSGCDQTALNSDLAAVRGIVKDKAGSGVVGAQIAAVGQDGLAVSDDTGAYVLALPPGEHTVTAEKTGYAEISQPVAVNSRYSEAVLNFTLEPAASSASVQIFLDAGDERFSVSEDVALTMSVFNELPRSISITGYGFYALDAAGNELWRHNVSLDGSAIELAGRQTRTFTANWSWFTNTPTVAPNSSVDCRGYITVASGGAAADQSNVVSVELLAPIIRPQFIPFDTIAQGLDCPIELLTAVVIKDEAAWQNFWHDYDDSSTAPPVNFDEQMVIAAMGGATTAVGSHVAVIALEHTPPANELICRVSRLYPPGMTTPTAGSMVQSAPYHIIVTDKRSEAVTFLWEELDLGP